ncbi:MULTISPECIES: serine hydrolase [unclassified Fusibacter]|uniref:serine hydrolase domain-containing protein n=1 Tax=unclassified Fusibacter TaxID=2624464 RepID=UPI00101378A6|nr:MULTISPECIES: serine hydrolase domain-containing protein [unclassified Fusibacter]MCK8059700.1 beta-lactamase family protein [Fusibacter sp. A2]NPE21501.1 beta-lactamase family protein [Fusibacter sp. A1]RXV61911.1 class A beta-lactamase-related serine hydrolase [Fusibacter sp. A1]
MEYSIKNHEVNSLTANITVPWWSFGKTVLATAILVLVEQGKLDLETNYYGLRATLKELLQHRSGLKDYGDFESYQLDVKNKALPWTFEEMLLRTNSDELLFEPGTEWKYSNIGYGYIRNLIVETTKMDLEGALKSLIFDKLKLTDVKVAVTSNDLKYCAYVVKNYDPGWVYHGMITGSLKSAAVFFDRLMTGEILSMESIDLMFTPHLLIIDSDDRPWKVPAYGLGMMMDMQEGNLHCMGHTGIGPGSAIAVYHFPHGKVPITVAISKNVTEEGPIEHDVVNNAKYNQ